MLQVETLVDTTVSQAIPGRNQSQDSQTVTVAKPYAELRLGDEINAFCGRLFIRCRVIKKLVEGNFVRLTLTRPTRNFAKDHHQQRFVGTALAQVYVERTPTEQEAIAQHQSWLLAVIEPGQVYTLLQLSDAIADRYGKRVGKVALSKAGRQLCRQGRLFAGKQTGTTLTFRAALPREANYPVVEFAGKESERLGWVVEWRWFHPTQSLQPVVCYLNGFEGFSNEERLTPATAKQQQRIEVARLRAAGQPIEGVVELSEWLLLELRESWSDRPARDAVLVRIAQALGLLPLERTDFPKGRKDQIWNQILDYLETYYPGWQGTQQQRRAS